MGTSEGMKTRATSKGASLDSLMAGFQSEGRAKTALGMPLKEFSESAVDLLMSNYKVENEKVFWSLQEQGQDPLQPRALPAVLHGGEDKLSALPQGFKAARAR